MPDYRHARDMIDGDKTYSLFERGGHVKAVSGSGWTFEGAAGVYKTNPLE